MCDVGYLCANFGLPKPLCSRVRPDVRDRRQPDSSVSVHIVLGRNIRVNVTGSGPTKRCTT